MKDKREYGLVDMLKELRENDEARYPANTAHRPGKPDCTEPLKDSLKQAKERVNREI